jgi:hypothetical protein
MPPAPAAAVLVTSFRIDKGGVVMIPLALCSITALAVVIERACRWLRLAGLAEADRVLAAGSGRPRWPRVRRRGRPWPGC